MTAADIQFHDLHTTRDEFVDDVLEGLIERPASIPPKYFYDSNGSRLFDAITELPEYYQTRTEIEILQRYAPDIARRVGTGSLLVEPGGGSCAKVHILLEGLQPRAYVPMDISHDHLRLAAEELAIAYPWLEIHAACTDYTKEMALPPTAPKGTHVAFFPGSSIGNFDPDGAVDFLLSVAELLGSGGYLLIGVDLKKDQAMLEAAYDDSAGVTAELGEGFVQVLEGEDAIARNREIMGATNPADAAPGTIRADFAESIEENIVHGSDAPETAATEIAFFFGDDGVCPRTR